MTAPIFRQIKFIGGNSSMVEVLLDYDGEQLDPDLVDWMWKGMSSFICHDILAYLV